MSVRYRIFYTILAAVIALLFLGIPVKAGWLPEVLIFGPGSSYYSIQMEADGNIVHIAFFGNGPGFLGEVGYIRSINQGQDWSDPHYFTLFYSGRTGSYPMFQKWQNKILVTWRDYGGHYHDYNIGYSISNNNGVSWTEPYYIMDPGHEGMTRISTCNFENDIHVMFHLSDGYEHSVYYMKSTDFGQNWSNEDYLFTFDYAEDGDIVAYGNYVHYFFGGWPDDTSTAELYYIRSTNAGASWSPPKVISHEDGYSSRFPRAAINSDGYVGVIWKDLRRVNGDPKYGYYVTVSTDDGSGWGIPVRATANTDFGTNKEITWKGDTLYIAWQARSDFWIPYYRIFYRYSKNLGLSWSAADTIDSYYIYHSEYPDIAASEGQLYAVWVDDRYIEDESGMYFSRYEEESTVTENYPQAAGLFELDIHPNPFNSSLTISYRDIGSNEIEIYNIMGQMIRSFPVGDGTRGQITWDGEDCGGNLISSGIYYIRISRDNKSISKKVLFLK